MLKKLKELFGFPTEQEQAAAKAEVKEEPKVEVKPPVFTSDTTTWPFPTSDKPEAEPKVKKPRVAKPKAEKAPVEKTPAAKKPAKKPAAKKPAKKPAAKKPATKKPTTRKAKIPVVGSGDVKQS